jgi:hypothetical protein
MKFLRAMSCVLFFHAMVFYGGGAVFGMENIKKIIEKNTEIVPKKIMLSGNQMNKILEFWAKNRKDEQNNSVSLNVSEQDLLKCGIYEQLKNQDMTLLEFEDFFKEKTFKICNKIIKIQLGQIAKTSPEKNIFLSKYDISLQDIQYAICKLKDQNEWPDPDKLHRVSPLKKAFQIILKKFKSIVAKLRGK